MGPVTTAEYQDCRVDELETALGIERERNAAARSKLQELAGELAAMRETCDERIMELEEFLSGKRK